ncbi:ankyrin repeat domain-containing protein 27-like [Ornithodoros turicata]|uniref:ankyrin repeat domain-containing protein 27-like n=1 Tax=Ornithodoros turicata TaxID=34597 RepID=UPI003138DFA9
MSAEELDYNPYFNALQTTFKSKYDEAQEKRWLVCIPCTASLQGVKITGKFVDAHILKPSPLFRSHYVCAYGDLNRTLEFDGENFRAVSGFGSPFTAKVLSEEGAYNKSFEPYKLLTISRPLTGDSPSSDSQVMSACGGGESDYLWTYKECCAFLKSFPCHGQVLDELDRKLSSFCSTYMVLPAYLHDTSEKLKKMISSTVKQLKRMHVEPPDSKTCEQIGAATESYVLQAAHQKVFNAVKQLCKDEDTLIAERLRRINGLLPDQLGVADAFCCPLPRAVVELASLDAKTTPLEKLWCLKSTLKIMSEEIYESPSYKCARLKSPNVELHLTSDDLIPILVCLIVKARLNSLASNLYYIQNFNYHVPDKDVLGYTLVTFQAAKEFIRTEVVNQLQPSDTKIKAEISPTELMEVTAKLHISEKRAESPSKSRPIDRHLQQVTKLIEASTQEFQQQEVEDLQNLFKAAEEVNRVAVGDFVMGLQDPLGVSYGKLESPK